MLKVYFNDAIFHTLLWKVLYITAAIFFLSTHFVQFLHAIITNQIRLCAICCHFVFDIISKLKMTQ